MGCKLSMQYTVLCDAIFLEQSFKVSLRLEGDTMSQIELVEMVFLLSLGSIRTLHNIRVRNYFNLIFFINSNQNNAHFVNIDF